MGEPHDENANNHEEPKVATRHKTKSAEKRSKRSKVVTRLIFWAAPPICIAVFYLFLIHFTSLRLKLGTDPIGRSIEITQQKFAGSNAAKASTHLTISENRFNDYTASQGVSTKPGYQSRLIEQMIQQNRLAIGYMDAAKKDGKDIKKLNLVKRLCDLLSDQNKALSETNKELLTQHNFAEKLEDKVEGGQTVDKAIEEVRKDLNAAMHW